MQKQVFWMVNTKESITERGIVHSPHLTCSSRWLLSPYLVLFLCAAMCFRWMFFSLRISRAFSILSNCFWSPRGFGIVNDSNVITRNQIRPPFQQCTASRMFECSKRNDQCWMAKIDSAFSYFVLIVFWGRKQKAVARSVVHPEMERISRMYFRASTTKYARLVASHSTRRWTLHWAIRLDTLTTAETRMNFLGTDGYAVNNRLFPPEPTAMDQ